MKKIILSISLLLFWLICTASVVTENQAAQYAQKFFKTSTPVKLVASSEQIAGSKGMEAPTYYIFNNPAGGWVIISGEDSSIPVVGYSHTGSFEVKGLPENVKFYMNDLRKDMKDLRSYNLPRTEKIEKAWNTVGEIDRSSAKKAPKTIKSAQWNQSAPYNKYSPIAGTPAGCVATAMAIVMRHNKWPEKGNGVISGYTMKNGTNVPAKDINNKKYDWDKMPETDAIEGKWSTSEIDLVADLMNDCGYMVQMEYSSDGSGAYSEDVPAALAKHMRYCKTAKLEQRCLYTKDEWNNKILNELSNDRLVYYSGSGSGGHAFVCDGIDTGANDEKYLRINWGWGGKDNGWFTRDLYLSSSYQFGKNQDAIFGLVPDPSGSSEEPAATVIFIPYSTYYGWALTNGEIKKNKEFSISAGRLFNNCSNKYTGEVGIAVADKDENVKYEPTTSIKKTIESNYLSSFTETKTITSDLAVTDQLILVNKINGKTYWEKIQYDRESAGFLGTIGVTASRIILFNDNVKAGDRLQLKLTPGQKGTNEVTWKFNGISVKNAITLVSGRNEIIANITYSDGATETVNLILDL